jgi:UDP-N-acetylmuramate-alanine ligase
LLLVVNANVLQGDSSYILNVNGAIWL